MMDTSKQETFPVYKFIENQVFENKKLRTIEKQLIGNQALRGDNFPN